MSPFTCPSPCSVSLLDLCHRRVLTNYNPYFLLFHFIVTMQFDSRSLLGRKVMAGDNG